MHFPVTNSPTNPFAPAPLEFVRDFPTQIIRDREGRGEDKELKRGERREHDGGQNTTVKLLCSFYITLWSPIFDFRIIFHDDTRCVRP